MKILVTGGAGFIGYHMTKKLLADNHEVVGLDNLNDYYDVNLKLDRLKELKAPESYRFVKFDMADADKVASLFKEEKFDIVINFAAQAGVRYSLENPRAYVNSNLLGFFNILENCRNHGIKHLLYASSSSVYGLNTLQPYSVHHNVDHPISLYAATKKSNELMSHSYAHLFGVPCTGLRFFTVYGPWDRPDMALAKFCHAIHIGKPLQLYNYGNMQRDFTYVDDIVNGIFGLLNNIPEANKEWSGDNPDPSSSPTGPYRICNIGAGNPVKLERFLELIEKEMGRKAIVERVGMQPGDVPSTFADISNLEQISGYKPQVSIEEGIKNYVAWYTRYYNVPKNI